MNTTSCVICAVLFAGAGLLSGDVTASAISFATAMGLLIYGDILQKKDK